MKHDHLHLLLSAAVILLAVAVIFTNLTILSLR